MTIKTPEQIAAEITEGWTRLDGELREDVSEAIVEGIEADRAQRPQVDQDWQDDAHNHAAHDLREALDMLAEAGSSDDPDLAIVEAAERMDAAARALLAAIGEGEA